MTSAIVRATDITSNLDDIQRIGKMLAVTGYFAAKGDGNVAIAQMATQILAGREMGYGPFASVQGIHIINGKPALSANLMAAAVKNSPRYDYRVREISDQVCRIEFFEYVDGKREPLGVSEFTIVQAQKAGVKNLDKFARNMLFARAISNGVRWYCPDVFSGNAVYVPEELGAEVDGDGDVIVGEATPVEAPGRAQTPATLNHTATPAKTQQQPATLATVTIDAAPEIDANGPEETPPHQRVWGIGKSIFGPDWDTGARAWAVENWTIKHTPQQVRTSLAALSDDEKDLLGDAMNANVAPLQKAWAKAKQAMAVAA